MNHLDVINRLDEKVKATLKALVVGAVPARYRARHGRSLQDDHFVDIFAEKHGTAGLVEFSRIMTIDELRRLGADAVADEFCKDAGNALANIDVK
jgi:hypothetical protein